MSPDHQAHFGTGMRILLALTGFIVVVGGIRAADAILVPFLLAAFIAILAATPLFALQRRGVPGWLALVIVIAMVVVAGMGFTIIVSSSAREFAQELPFYTERVRELWRQALDVLHGWGLEFSRDTLLKSFDPSSAMNMAGRAMQGLAGVLSNAFLILITVIFILLEAGSFQRKLGDVLEDPDEALPRFAQITTAINQYMAIKTSTSLATGVLVALLLSIMGVDFALLWGTLAFLLNFVPNIGSFLAAVPAVLLTTVQLGITEAVVVAIGYAVINVVMGNGIEPRFMGRGMGVSPLVVWISLVFWGWALGPVGMLLSVPLTTTLKIALEAHPGTHWLGVLLGPASAIVLPEPPDPDTAAVPAEPADPA